MLNLKKVIALVCVFALALSTVAFGATYTDVTEESAYYEAVETLNKLEIVTGYEDGTYKPEDGVTRAEMAALIARIQGYGETAKAAANTGFKDVPASHWASGYIANAAGMGIINGYGDGTFGPEDPVKYEQAVKMVMATLGYTPFAEKNGGYPTGYLAAAQRYDVSLAVANAAVGSDANRGTVAQILANALDTPLMIQARWSNTGEVDYVIADGNTTGYPYQTLMSANLGYVKIRGIVTENALVNINGTKNIDTTKDATVVFGNGIEDFQSTNSVWVKDNTGASVTEFLVGDTDVADYIGHSVVGYVKKVGNDWTMISAAIDTARNDELVIALDAFAGHDTTVGKEAVKYYKDGANDVTSVKVSDSIAVVYNNDGVNAYTSSFDALKGSLYGGAITLIDNDEVRGYDVAFIELAETAIVKKVTEDGINLYNTLTLYADKFIEIDADDETKVVKVMKDGVEIDASELNEWDVLSVYADGNAANVIIAEVAGEQVVGTVSSKKDSKASQGGKAFKVNDTWYDVAAGAYKYTDLDVAEGGTIYVDKFGKIAAFIEDSALAGGLSANYAYVLGMEAEAASFGATGVSVNVQMVTADGVKVLPLKSNVVYEDEDTNSYDFDLTKWAYTKGTPDTVQSRNADATTANKHWNMISNDTTATTAIAATAADGIVGTVVQYVVNSNGYITKITEAGHDTAKFKANATLGDGSSQAYDADNSKFANGYVDNDTIVFIIGNATTSRVGTLADLDHENSYTVNAAYADKKAEDNNIIVVPYSDLLVSKTSSIAVIKEAGNGINAAEEAVWTITYLVDGEEVTANTDADTATGTIPTPGDIVKVKLDGNGVITNISTIWNFKENIRPADLNASTSNATTASATETATFSGTSTAKEKFYGGVVLGYKDTSTEAKLNYADTNASPIDIKLSRAANVYVIDALGRTTIIKNGSDANFKAFEALYDSTKAAAAFTLADDDNATADVTISAGAGSQTSAQAYADHVYVRTYEDRATDVVIVKSALKKVQ